MNRSEFSVRTRAGRPRGGRARGRAAARGRGARLRGRARRPTAARRGSRRDHDRLLQIASNLVENALRETPAGGAVTVARRAGAQLSVSDTGPGHPARRRAARVRALLPLRQDRQGPSGRQRARPRDRAASSRRAMGGDVRVESEPGGDDVRRPRYGRSFEVSTTSKSEPVSAPSACSWSFDQCGLGRARDVPVRAVVGDDHPVGLHRLRDDARLRRQLARCSTLAFSRTRSPIGGSDGSVELELA